MRAVRPAHSSPSVTGRRRSKKSQPPSVVTYTPFEETELLDRYLGAPETDEFGSTVESSFSAAVRDACEATGRRPDGEITNEESTGSWIGAVAWLCFVDTFRLARDHRPWLVVPAHGPGQRSVVNVRQIGQLGLAISTAVRAAHADGELAIRAHSVSLGDRFFMRYQIPVVPT